MICNGSEVLFKQTEFKLQNVYNIHEIGFLIGFAQPEKVTIVRIPRQQGRLHVQDGNPEMITVLEGSCADGTSLEPLIIVNGDHICHNWFDNAEHVPHMWLF
jgi:hypothetical protein